MIAAFLGMLIRCDPATKLHHELECRAPGCTDPNDLDERTREVLKALAQGVARFVDEPDGLHSSSREALLGRIAKGSRRMGVVLTEPAWEEIEQADVEMLRFLSAMSRVADPNLYQHAPIRALFESRALRCFGMSAWQLARGE